MNNFILKKDDITMHFFHMQNQGIALRTKKLNIWQNHKIILPNSKEIFAVFSDDIENIINIISITEKNELLYTHLKNDVKKSHILSALKDDMTVKSISLFKNRIGLNIVYTADYQGKILLIHCPLGNNALPEPIDEISGYNFTIYKSSVCYTNSKGFLGYKNLSDGKADMFNSLTHNAHSPYLYSYHGMDFITYKKNDEIYFQNRPLAVDPSAINPIIAEDGENIFVMWQSSDFIRYRLSKDGGDTFTPTMQYVSSGKIPHLISVINYKTTFKYYASISTKGIRIFGAGDVFSKKASIPENCSPPIAPFKVILNAEKEEILKLKDEISRLNDAIETLRKNNVKKSDKS